MVEVATAKSHRMLFFNTLAFVIAFAAWMLNGVLVTFLVDNQVFNWDAVETGWLLGIPVLTGSLFRLPIGMLTDKYGGKYVFGLLLLFTSIPMYLLSTVDSFLGYALCSLGFGMTGAAFAVGIAFTSVWYPKQNQGFALGVFGAGNAGAALTALVAPTLLLDLTKNDIDGWRTLPIYYAIMLLVMGIVFLLGTENKKTIAADRTAKEMLKPLKDVRVWRYGLYYFLVFGCFVAFSQWLIPYFVSVYYLPLVVAGMFAAAFSFPSGVIRAFGGWLSDKYGARRVMFWTFATSTFISLMLIIPKMDIYSPGEGVMAKRAGTVTAVTETTITVDEKIYPYFPRNVLPTENDSFAEGKILVFPTKDSWQEPVVKVGDQVKKKQLLAKGTTKIFFQANVWIFAILVILIGTIWGIGKAGVYKFIPDNFPNEVGIVGGMVGVIGGLGGFVTPIIFGYLLKYTGVWSSAWIFMFFLSLLSLWMLNHYVLQRLKN
jgi:NNP family nitrate/nitrite transporter-like MFS transporter